MQQVLEVDEQSVEDWEIEWVNDATGESQEVEWFVEDGEGGKQSSNKVLIALKILIIANARDCPVA